MHTRFWFAFLLVPLFFLLPRPAAASGSLHTLTVSPALQQITLSPRVPAQSFNLTLTNTTASPISALLEGVNFDAISQSGVLSFLGVSQRDLHKQQALAPWIKLDHSSVELMPGQSTMVGVTILNQSAMSPGGHYGAITITVAPAAQVSGNEVELHQVLSSLLFVTKQGGETYGLTVDKTQTDQSWWGIPSQVGVTFANSGNTHVTPHGLIRVKDGIGRLISQGQLNVESGIVLPGSKRQFSADLVLAHMPLWPGMYHEQIFYHYQDKPFAVVEKTFMYPGMLLPLILLVILTFAWLIYWRWSVRRNQHERASFFGGASQLEDLHR